MTSMKKIPCKNCICFPACKSQAVEKTFKNEMHIRLSVLHRKCEVFAKWYARSGYPTEKIKECFNVSYATWLQPGW
jgi:hypothetical protein